MVQSRYYKEWASLEFPILLAETKECQEFCKENQDKLLAFFKHVHNNEDMHEVKDANGHAIAPIRVDTK